MDITLLAQMAELAEASYADLQGLDLINIADIRNALIAGGQSETQVDQLLNNWTVLQHQPNTASGYSATLFQSTNSNVNAEYVLAFRGTQPGAQLGLDLAEDFGNIVTDGLAFEQIVDLYNDWQRIQAGVRTDGTGNTYTAAVVTTRATETAALLAERLLIPGTGITGPVESALRARNDIIIDDPTGLVRTIEFVPSEQVFTGSEAYRATGNINLPAGATITVAGHSLGGHLATAFTRLFAGQDANAYTFNGAGYMSGILDGLGGNAESNIRNVLLAA